MNNINHKNFFYPPGGILIWMIIIVELATFTAGIGAYLWQRSLAPGAFNASQSTLNSTVGFINTLVLLTSGFFVAEATHLLKTGREKASLNRIIIAIIFGIAFLIIKSTEYSDKLSHGHDLTYDTFFTFYWLLTGFHFLHVLTGVVILSVLAIKIKKSIYSPAYSKQSGLAGNPVQGQAQKFPDTNAPYLQESETGISPEPLPKRYNYLDVETGAAFWHLCDLIWLLLFPTLYLIK